MFFYIKFMKLSDIKSRTIDFNKLNDGTYTSDHYLSLTKVIL